MNIQEWFTLVWTGWISLQSKGLSRVFSNTTVQKHQFFRRPAFFIVQLSYPYMTTGKTIALNRQTFVGKTMSLLFNMLSRLVIAFLPRSKHLLISRLQSPSAVILEPKKPYYKWFLNFMFDFPISILLYLYVDFYILDAAFHTSVDKYFELLFHEVSF